MNEYRLTRSALEYWQRDRRWLFFGVGILGAWLFVSLSTRSGFIHGLLVSADGDYTRYDMARFWLLPMLPVTLGWLIALNSAALRSASENWRDRLPRLWQGRSPVRPQGSAAVAWLCLLLFVGMPITGAWLTINMYMDGESCDGRKKARSMPPEDESKLLHWEWSGHLLGSNPDDAGARRTKQEGCAISTATRITYGRSMDYWPYAEPWSLLMLVVGATGLGALYGVVLGSRRGGSRLVEALWTWQRAFDMRSLSLVNLVAAGAPMDPEWDVFISYSGSEREEALEIGEALRAADLKIWLDTDDVESGDLFVEKMREGLTRSRFVVVILSDAFLGSEWALRELYSGLILERKRGVETVIPIVAGLPPQLVEARLPELAQRSMADIGTAADDLPGLIRRRLRTDGSSATSN